MILFFDTETTGFPHKHKPVDHPDQPHVIQLAAILAEESGNVISSFSFLIDPGVENGVRIPSGAQAVHGIDEEKLWRFGHHPIDVLSAFDSLYARADLIVGHNLDFDVEMMLIALSRHKAMWKWFEGPIKERFCTMKELTDICRIPATRSVTTGRGGYKWPKLGEAYKHFFGEELTGAHDAMNDVRACMRIYFRLKEGGGRSVPAAAKSGEEW